MRSRMQHDDHGNWNLEENDIFYSDNDNENKGQAYRFPIPCSSHLESSCFGNYYLLEDERKLNEYFNDDDEPTFYIGRASRDDKFPAEGDCRVTLRFHD